MPNPLRQLKSRLKTLATGLVLLLLLAGCTASFTYNHLDWIIPWYVDDYVDLTRDQKKSLREQLEPFLQWHRQEELQRYVEILDGIEAAMDEPLTAAQVYDWIQQIIDALERTEYSMLKVGLSFGDQLTEAQFREFMDSLWERQRNFEEEFLERTDQEYAEDNADEMISFMKKLIGRLDNAQEDRLIAAGQDLCRFDKPWLKDSEDWLNELGPILQKRPGWQDEVEAAFVARKAGRSDEFRECLDRNYAVISAAVADVLNQASDRQREHLYREIDKLRERLVRLIEADVEV